MQAKSAVHPLEIALVQERSRLLRWMTRLTGDPAVADDIVQDAAIEAWRNRHKLTDLSGVVPWLNAVTANVYKRWAHQHGLRISRETQIDPVELQETVEIELEHDDLADLLDKAMEQLPPQTRAILIARYLEEQPQAKVARDLGISESALAVRLHRGKLALRQVIETEQQQDTAEWQSTRIWCGNCGQAHYQAKHDPDTGELILICPNCTPSPETPAWGHNPAIDGNILQGILTLKPAINRMLAQTHAYLSPALPTGRIVCPSCGREATIHQDPPPEFPALVDNWMGIHIRCHVCGLVTFTGLGGIAGATPQARQFNKEHPRHHILPPRYVEHEGRSAIILRFESLRHIGTLDVLFAADTYEILKVFRDGKDDTE